jgi:hypothetical protein
MKDKDQKLIYEAYVTEREYGPSGGVSLNYKDWEVVEVYEQDDWNSGQATSYDEYIDATLDSMHGVDTSPHGEEDNYLAFFSPKQGTGDYESWTDPVIILALHWDRESEGVDNYGAPYFVDKDGDGESHELPEQVGEILAKLADPAVEKLFFDKNPRSVYDPYGPDGVVSRSDFY